MDARLVELQKNVTGMSRKKILIEDKTVSKDISTFKQILEALKNLPENKQQDEAVSLCEKISVAYLIIYRDLNSLKSQTNKDIYLSGRFIIEMLNQVAEIYNQFDEAYEIFNPLKIIDKEEKDAFYPPYSQCQKDFFEIKKEIVPAKVGSPVSALSKLFQEKKPLDKKIIEQKEIEHQIIELRTLILKFKASGNIKKCVWYVSQQLIIYDKRRSRLDFVKNEVFKQKMKDFFILAKSLLEIMREIKDNPALIDVLGKHLPEGYAKKSSWNLKEVFVGIYEKLDKDDHCPLLKEHEASYKLAKGSVVVRACRV